MSDNGDTDVEVEDVEHVDYVEHISNTRRAPAHLPPIVEEYFDLCNKINEAKEDLKLVNERKNELQEKISNYMIKEGLDSINTTRGKIKVVSSKSMKSLNKDYLREALCKRLSDAKIAEELAELIFEQRPVTAVKKIRIIKGKE